MSSTVNGKDNSLTGNVTIIDSSIQNRRVESEMSSDLKAVVKNVLLKHPESQAGLRYLFDPNHNYNDLDEIFSPTLVEIFSEEEDYNQMAGVCMGPRGNQAQYRSPVVNNVNSPQGDPSYINRRLTREEMMEHKNLLRKSQTFSAKQIRVAETQRTWQRLFKIIHVLSWGNVISRFDEQKLIELFYGKAKNRDYNFRPLNEKEKHLLANAAEDYLQEAKVLGMLDGIQEKEYLHILESIDPKCFFKNSRYFDPVLIKKAGKEVASHRYMELKREYKTRLGLDYAEELTYEFLMVGPSANDKRETLMNKISKNLPFPAVNKKRVIEKVTPTYKVAEKMQSLSIPKISISPTKEVRERQNDLLSAVGNR